MTATLVTDRIDNWLDYSFDEYRVFDTIASILHIHSSCSAALIDPADKRIKVSFNSPTGVRESSNPETVNSEEPEKHESLMLEYEETVGNVSLFVRLFDQIIQLAKAQDVRRMLLNYQLVVTTDTRELIDKEQRHYLIKSDLSEHQEEYKRLVGQVKADLDAFFRTAAEMTTVEELVEFISRTDIATSYMSLIKHIKADLTEEVIGSDDDKTSKGAIYASLVRPLIDTLKFSVWLKKYPDRIEHETIILSNDDNLHAEINLVLKFRDQMQQIGYVGISKLACPYCHFLFKGKAINHRGCHGVASPKWRICVNWSEFVWIMNTKLNVTLTEVDGDPLVRNEKRRLSVSWPLDEDYFNL